MNHRDHVNLIRSGIPAPGGVWADLGAGQGAFTLALAELTGPESTIYAVDKDQGALQRLARAVAQTYPTVHCTTLVADFTQPAQLPPLDGIVMANSLHFLHSKDAMLQRVLGYLRPGGRLIVVEYDTDRGNYWVPYPISFATWTSLSRRNGFSHTELLATHPSSFLGRFFAAASW